MSAKSRVSAIFRIRFPDNEDFLNEYAWFLIDKKGDLARARPLIEKALDEDPDDPFSIDTLGYLLLKERKKGEAAAQFEKALEKEGLGDKAREQVLAHLREAKEKSRS